MDTARALVIEVAPFAFVALAKQVPLLMNVVAPREELCELALIMWLATPALVFVLVVTRFTSTGRRRSRLQPAGMITSAESRTGKLSALGLVSPGSEPRAHAASLGRWRHAVDDCFPGWVSLWAMTYDELAALEHENWVGYVTGVVRCTSRANVTRDGGVVTILTGLPFDWFNQVLIEREEATPARVLAAVAQARERGDHFVVRLREGIDDRFIPTLTQAGLAPAGEGTLTPGMVAFPIDDAIAKHAAPDLEIRRVTDAAGIDAHRQAVTAGFGSDPAVALGTACPDLVDRHECVVYVGYADGNPVVSGLGWRTGRTIGVYSIATIESARRRGYGAAMTARAVADGVVAGCDVAALQASEMGRPTYERLGFRTVVRYAAYIDPVLGA